MRNRILIVLACILFFTYGFYLLGELYGILIFNKLGPYYAVNGSFMAAWLCGFICTLLLSIVVLMIIRAADYIRNG